MKICLVHNFYLRPGGEDNSFRAESSILKKHGHRIFQYTVSNDRIKELNPLKLVYCTLWNKTIVHELLGVIRKFRPDVIHFNNTFPLISPAAYYVAKAEGLPVVQSLRNYRLLCPNALFFRNGHVCEDCMGKFIPFPGVLHACYRESRVATTVTVAMLSLHRLLRTYSQMVDVYIALTEFSRNKFIRGGFPAEKIVMKPNFIETNELSGKSVRTAYRYALFVGRLSPEKGVRNMLMAWRFLGGISLKVVGDGPLMGEVGAFVKMQGLRNVDLMGHLAYDEVLMLIRKARFLVFPSECYENFGRVIAEAFACGVPVITSRLGAMAEIVEDRRTGLHFEPGNPKDMAAKVEWAWSHEKEMENMGKEARKEYERKYTAEINYKMLIDIYETAIERSRMKK